MFVLLCVIIAGQADVATWTNGQFYVRLAWDNSHHVVAGYGRPEHINLYWFKIRGVKANGHFRCGEPVEDWVIFRSNGQWIVRARIKNTVKVWKAKNWSDIERHIHVPPELKERLRRMKTVHFGGGHDDDDGDSGDGGTGNYMGKPVYFDRSLFPPLSLLALAIMILLLRGKLLIST